MLILFHVLLIVVITTNGIDNLFHFTEYHWKSTKYPRITNIKIGMLEVKLIHTQKCNEASNRKSEFYMQAGIWFSEILFLDLHR